MTNKNKLAIAASRSSILMSDVLKGNVPELDEDAVDEHAHRFIMTTMELTIDGEDADPPIAGSINNIELSDDTYVEVRVALADAFDILRTWDVKRATMKIKAYHLTCGQETMSTAGPFEISSVTLKELSLIHI